ncbi:M12 family metallopeptidase [Flavobacterium chilense]|uniref:Astacin (Peptidase family M12A) n=1 Tax=Flavobacterium chilense TaxID=946677 RepID=A0A1M6XEM1_9FLAO|nr:M12 family metallopeptidase [Flavobacterium chilense]SHL04392.1 Astacin (Peptidase family M12A) [Flavobacterium chilense]
MKKNLWIILLTFFLLLLLALWWHYRQNQIEGLKRLKFCTEIRSGKEQKKKKGGTLYIERVQTAASEEFKWDVPVGLPLRLEVKFMNGTSFQINKVKLYAKEWEVASEHDPDKIPNIRFNFISPQSSVSGDIRISFEPGGSESAIGRDAKNIPKEQPTMKLGWVNEHEPEKKIRQLILHEFGHVLGLVHEHQLPGFNIRWDKEKVYEYYKITQNPPWKEEKVDSNIFFRYDKATLNSLKYDSTSIMHYEIPDSLTENKCCPVAGNFFLSEVDIEIVRKLYQITPCDWSEKCCYNSKGQRIPCKKTIKP